MSTSLRQGTADIEAEADRLGLVIDKHAAPLQTARLGTRFRLEDASFRLHSKARNTLYRVSGRFDWFLKLPSAIDPLTHERIGAEALTQALRRHPEYAGALVIRVSTRPGYVLAAAIPGRPLNTVFFTQCWIPGGRAAARLEHDFRILGRLTATLHVDGHVEPDTPRATTRPFERLRTLLDQVQKSDAVVDAIALWCDAHQQPDTGDTLIHGNLRMDNVLRLESRLGFIDFENCGKGSFYQDLSRPVSQLLLTRSLLSFPWHRATGCLKAFVDAYAKIHPYEPRRLWEYIGVRQARHYLETRKRRPFEDRVGGMPVLKGKLDRFTLAVVREPFESILPEIGL